MSVTEGKHKTFKLQHGDNVREFSNVVVTKLEPGRYELLCNMAGHYLGGMRTELVVR